MQTLEPCGKMALQADPKLLSRLSRIERQVRGIARIVEEEILQGHAAHCVAHAIHSGDIEDQKQKFAELVKLFARYAR